MGNYKRKTERALKFTEELMQAVRGRLENGESKRSIAKSIGVNECTLRKRLKQGTIPTSLGRYRQTFSEREELELAEDIRELEKRFYGLTLKDVKSLAYQYASLNRISHRFDATHKMAGRRWATNFCKRHNLSLRSPEKCSLARAAGFNKVQCKRFFANLTACYDKYKCPPQRIFNMDETGLSTVPNRLPKIVAPKGKKCVSKIVAAERGQLITGVCCMSASGSWVPPALIFPRKRMKDELYFGAPTGTLKLISDSGYMNSDLFLVWLRHFASNVKPSKDDPVLLLLDNHVSHCSLEAILFCREHFIVMLTLPPHSSHKLQPLDKGYFAPLKTAFSQECDKWMVTNQGKPITQKQMASLFNAAYSRTATVQICQKSFEATGLYPFNPDVFSEDDFAPAEVTERRAEMTNTPIETLDQQAEENGPGKIPDTPTDQNRKDQLADDADESSEDEIPLSCYQIKLMNNVTPDANKQSPRETNNDSLYYDPLRIDAVPGPSGVLPKKATKAPSKPITPKMILPLPKATHEVVRRKNSKKSEVLTSTPYKEQLTQKKDGENVKKRLLKSEAKSSQQIAKKPKKEQKKKEDDTLCSGCSEHYSTSPWIQCKECEEWWHEDCTNYLGFGTFACDFCAEK